MTQSRIERGPSVSAALSIILATLFCLSAYSCAFDAPRARVLSSAHAKEITTIELAFPRAEYPIRVERRKGEWFLILDDTHRYPANAPRVSSFIQALRAARSVRVFDRTEGAYGIDSSTSPRIRAVSATGTVLLDLLAGSVTAAGTSQYFHDGLSGRAIRVEPPLDSFIEGTTAFWAELTPFENAFREREIERVLYKKGDDQRAIARGSTKNASELIDSFQRDLSSLSCVDVTNIPFTAAESITLEFGDTSSMRISIMPLNDNYAVIRRESDGAAWVIAETAHKALIGSF